LLPELLLPPQATSSKQARLQKRTVDFTVFSPSVESEK